MSEKTHINQEELDKLTTAIQPFEKILSANLSTTYKEYLAGEVSHGSYQNVLQRHHLFTAIVNWDVSVPVQLAVPEEDNRHSLPPLQKLLLVLAPVVIDIKTGIDDLADDAKTTAKNSLTALLAFFKGYGFTDKSPIFEFPTLPNY